MIAAAALTIEGTYLILKAFVLHDLSDPLTRAGGLSPEQKAKGTICVVDQAGSVAREGVVDSGPEAISVYMRSKALDEVRTGLETGPASTWLRTELKRLGLPVICIDARHAKAVLKMQINKSDNNAIGIARIMQTGWSRR